ncbi:hypothetical protein ACLKA7_005773 [Drosophila subpalustris]
MASNQEQELQQSEGSSLTSSQAPGRRRVAPMPPDDVIRNSIARSLTQILVNMTNVAGQQHCRELLQADDLTHGAHIAILTHLERIDSRREQRERAQRERKQRRADKENQN